MAKFIISTDSCADYLNSFYGQNNVYCIIMKRIENGKEIGEIFKSEEEHAKFYENIKKGALPSTTQLNSYEVQDYFENILQKESQGDIIHIPLSSGLSGTCENAKAAANEINKTLTGRKIYVVDSLLASGGMAMLVDLLIEMRDAGVDAVEAVKRVEQTRDHQQTWFIQSDLFHLKRGGRISGFKAAIGTLLGVKPIITVSKAGRLQIENTMKGGKKAIQYVLSKAEQFGEKARPDFAKGKLYLFRSSKSELYDELKKAIIEKYPQAQIREYLIGPIIGTHVGCGTAALIFEGAPRLDI